MQSFYILLFICVLTAAVGWFAVMAFRRHRRTARLAQKAYQLNMRFAAADPFDIPRRFSRFAVISGGHSPSASNVSYGRIDGCPVRAFDFRYEAGHGTRRQTRHYGIIAIEVPDPLPEVLMWADSDARAAPADARRRDRRLGAWSFRGDEGLARTLAEACAGLDERVGGIQALGTAVLVSMPALKAAGDYTDDIARIRPLFGVIHDPSTGQGSSQAESPGNSPCRPEAKPAGPALEKTDET